MQARLLRSAAVRSHVGTKQLSRALILFLCVLPLRPPSLCPPLSVCASRYVCIHTHTHTSYFSISISSLSHYQTSPSRPPQPPPAKDRARLWPRCLRWALALSTLRAAASRLPLLRHTRPGGWQLSPAPSPSGKTSSSSERSSPRRSARRLQQWA